MFGIASTSFAGGGGACPPDLNGDGTVDGIDLGIVLFSWATDGEGDVDGDGTVNGTDLTAILNGWGDCPPATPEITLSLATESVSFTEGGNAGIAGSIEVTGLGGAPIVVEVLQTSTPAGLTIVNDVPTGGIVVAADGTYLFNTLLGGGSPGAFTLETIATPTVGVPDTATVAVEVLPLAGIPDLSSLGSEPAAVNPDVATEVVFTVSLTGTTSVPATFDLLATEGDGTSTGSVGTLRDDGVLPDAAAGDGVYTGAISVAATAEEEERYYKAAAAPGIFGGGLETAVYTLDVTPFPVGPSASDPDALVDAPDGTSIYSNELLVVFVPGTSDERIAEILALIDGTIVGSVPATAAYQVAIPGDGTAGGVFAAIAAMKTVVDVDVAEPILPITITELVPNDPLYPEQLGVRAIRANEAWTVATGTVAIAIVDTGVDAAHPDFAGPRGSKVLHLPGSDLVDGDDDPADEDGHGTRMAGIAAAIGDNGIGIAGVAWRSPIIAVRAFGDGASDVTLAAGIVFAATNGARVINVSGTFDAPSVVVERAIAFAADRGSVVVAASGNRVGGEDVERYPCAYPEVLCVGAYGDDGLPLEGTNVGPWVDLGAPGENLPTTALGGGFTTSTGSSGAAAMTAGALACGIRPDAGDSDPIAARLAALRLRAGADRGGDGPVIGDGRLDLLEAIFDGSFELYGIFPALPDLETWSTEGTVAVVESLGPLAPTDRSRMSYVSTGPAGAGIFASLRKDFVVQPGVAAFGITFDYDFITEEWPEFVGSEFNDSLRIVLVEPDGVERLLAVESVNASEFLPVEGIDFPGGDDTVGHTGWKTVSVVVPITKGPGAYTVRIEDAGDDLFDSVVLVDRIRLVGDPAAIYCGAPEAGSCCEPNGTPFCEEPACCDIVCSIDPTCCIESWDGLCAELASKFCESCGGAPQEICDNGIDDDGDGLVDCEDSDCANDPSCGCGGDGTPCDDGNPCTVDDSCVSGVCVGVPIDCDDGDPCTVDFCLDGECVNEPIPGCGTQEICDNEVDDDGDGLVDCADPDCAAFPGCGGSGLCGDPNAGSCCDADGTPFCDDEACCSTVCQFDPSCCETAWDLTCVALAVAVCDLCGAPEEVCDNEVDDDGDGLVDCADPDCATFPGCGGSGLCGDPNAGDCCEANGTPFCDDEACCSDVCAADPFCCESDWDAICAVAAAELCDLCGAPAEICDNGVDDDGNGLVDCADPACGDAPNCCGGELATFEMGDLSLAGGEIETLAFDAFGTPDAVTITFTFTGDGNSWASDLVLVVDDGTSPPVYWGGFDETFGGVVNGGVWPFDGAESAADGFYAGTVEVPLGGLALKGGFTIGIGNGWSGSQAVSYSGVKVTVGGVCGAP